MKAVGGEVDAGAKEECPALEQLRRQNPLESDREEKEEVVSVPSEDNRSADLLV